jgi:transposase
MLHRHAISDAEWERVKHLLPGRPGEAGWVARDNRLFLDAVLWIGKTGAPWRDLRNALASGTLFGDDSIAGRARGSGRKCSRCCVIPTWSG